MKLEVTNAVLMRGKERGRKTDELGLSLPFSLSLFLSLCFSLSLSLVLSALFAQWNDQAWLGLELLKHLGPGTMCPAHHAKVIS